MAKKSKRMSGMDKWSAKVDRSEIVTKGDLKRWGVLDEAVAECFTMSDYYADAANNLKDYGFKPLEILALYMKHDNLKGLGCHLSELCSSPFCVIIGDIP